MSSKWHFSPLTAEKGTREFTFNGFTTKNSQHSQNRLKIIKVMQEMADFDYLLADTSIHLLHPPHFRPQLFY